ncbi:hypothetical protein J2T08_000319 [Neorhizobium galegae]|uniref:hypothetical protein n=1 Tax=Neorhizobium galegae TaxID=399 RepID=UPI001AE26ED8|nr:hypothetical protein [Neorhizobium galegae]MBP2559636.1 hypothetical protein [Neorhizobium galegae]MDQ0132418.1 hypothetical protein [Neorhizobium galegae]
MLKGAWILPAVMLVALLVAALVPAEVFAAEPQAFPKDVQTYFRNLPGVVPEAEHAKKQAYECTSDIENVYRSRGGFDILYGDVMPTRIYRCKTPSGVTYTGTRMPNNAWAPGIHPYHLPE